MWRSSAIGEADGLTAALVNVTSVAGSEQIATPVPPLDASTSCSNPTPRNSAVGSSNSSASVGAIPAASGEPATAPARPRKASSCGGDNKLPGSANGGNGNMHALVDTAFVVGQHATAPARPLERASTWRGDAACAVQLDHRR